MLKRVLNAELEKKVFEDEMMEKLSVVPAEYEVYEEYASRQEDFDRDFFTYCNKTPLLVDADVASYDESEENVGVPNCKEKSLETFMAESQEEINKKKLEEARIKYHYKWSTQYIRKLEEENHRIRQNNCRLAKRNERLEEKNQNLLSECKDLRKENKSKKEKLKRQKQVLKKCRKTVFKNIKNGKWDNKRSRRLISKQDVDDLLLLL